jgi:hypothetical protein
MTAMLDRDQGSSGSTPPQPFGAHGQYDANGIDLSLIRANMRVTPTERARRAERARRCRPEGAGAWTSHPSEARLSIKRYLGRPKDRESLLHFEGIRRLREQEGLR